MISDIFPEYIMHAGLSAGSQVSCNVLLCTIPRG